MSGQPRQATSRACLIRPSLVCLFLTYLFLICPFLVCPFLICPFLICLFKVCPFLIPYNRYRLMVAREFLPRKPQLKSQIGRRDNDANVKLADIKPVPPREAGAALVLEHQLLLLYSVEVALDSADFERPRYYTKSVFPSSFEEERNQNSRFFMLVGKKSASFCDITIVEFHDRVSSPSARLTSEDLTSGTLGSMTSPFLISHWI